MGNFFSDIGKSIGKAVSSVGKALAPVAQIASVIPGPWQLPGQIITAVGALTGGSGGGGGGGASDIQAQTNQLMQQGADSQMAYQMAALQQYQNNLDRQLVTATADKQMAYDVSRGQYLANQGNALPYQQASLSALQSLPMLQQLLGVPAYNVGQTINQYTPPAINYSDLYSGQAQQMGGGQQTSAPVTAADAVSQAPGNYLQLAGGNGTSLTQNVPGINTIRFENGKYEMLTNTGWIPATQRALDNFAADRTQQSTGAASGIRVSMRAEDAAPSAPVAANGQQLPATTNRPGYGTAPATVSTPTVQLKQPVGVGQPIPTTEQITQQTLTPYTGPAYDLNNSPLFQWQKKIADEGLTAQLAASGLSDSTYAQRELSRQNQAITAAERERVVGNLQSLTSLGMSGSSLGQAQFTTPQTGGVSDIYGNAAQQLAAFQGNMGAIQGQLASQQAQNAMAGYNAQAQQPSGIQTALELASSYGWLGGNKTTQQQILSAMSNPYVNSAMTNANPFRLF